MPKKNDLYIYSKKIIGFFAVFVMLLLAMLAFFFQSRVSMEMQTMEKVSFHNNSILVYFFLVCMVTGLFVFRKRIEKIDSRKLYLFLSIIMFAVGMILVLGAGTDLRADALKIYESAKAFSKGDYSALEKGNYLYHYPHQLGMVSYEWLLLKIVDNVEVFFLANLLFVLFNIYILGEISYCLFDSQFVHNITLFLSFLFFPQLFFILFAYGTIPGFSMLLAAYYFQLIFLRKGTKKYFLLFVACACLSCLFKNNYLIGVLASFAVFIGENPMNIVHAFISVGIGFAVTFILTWMFGFEDVQETVAEAAKKETAQALEKKIEAGSPADGKAIPLSEMKDETLASGVLGKGAAVIPQNGRVAAPVSGKIVSVFPTKHAVSMVDENGAEILIHIGIDTVKLDGKYFTAHVKDGDMVKKGELLVEFDKKAVEAEGYDMTIAVLVTNSQEFLDVIPAEPGEIKEQEKLFTIL